MSNVSLGSPMMSVPRAKSEVNDELSRQTRVVGPGGVTVSGSP
jgi:hypothetical protein